MELEIQYFAIINEMSRDILFDWNNINLCITMQLKTEIRSVDIPCYHADYSYSRESLEESDLWSFAHQIATGMVS